MLIVSSHFREVDLSGTFMCSGTKHVSAAAQKSWTHLETIVWLTLKRWAIVHYFELVASFYSSIATHLVKGTQCRDPVSWRAIGAEVVLRKPPVTHRHTKICCSNNVKFVEKMWNR